MLLVANPAALDALWREIPPAFDQRFTHAEVDADAPVAVEDRRLVRIAEARQPRRAVGTLVLVVQAIDRQQLAAGKLHQQRVLFTAGHAPRGPDVEHPDLAE